MTNKPKAFANVPDEKFAGMQKAINRSIRKKRFEKGAKQYDKMTEFIEKF